MSENSLIKRAAYQEFLKRHRGKPIIKVITGLRRAGKSMIFELFKKDLKASGVKQSNIISLNFEDLKYYELRDYKKLHKYLEAQIKSNKKHYILLDEIQHVDKFELVVDSLFIKDNVDLYITGSNAYYMSGELATNLTGRYVEKEVQPLSFAEYYSWSSEKDIEKAFNEYWFSAFPYLIHTESYVEKIEYLQGVYNSILINDVIARAGKADKEIIERVMRTVLSSIGSITSINKMRNTLASQNVKLANNTTLERYVSALCDGLLLYSVPRFDVKGRELLQRLEKYYASDLGFRNLLLPDHQEDTGHLIENIVYLELRRRYPKVYIGNIDKYEVDFVVVTDKGSYEYYQVSESVLDPKTRDRELKPLRKITDNFPKYLLVMDKLFLDDNYEGIQKKNILDWLIE
ncbi:MAG: ATP-binding protein [Micrococcaceae bacterium]